LIVPLVVSRQGQATDRLLLIECRSSDCLLDTTASVSYNHDDAALLRLLGDNLRRLREATSKSQDALANDSGLHRTYVGAVERGERNPTYLTLVKYARGLGLSVADLTQGPQ